MSLRSLGLALFLLLVAAVPAADAGTLARSGNTMQYVESDGDVGQNDVRLGIGSGSYVFEDFGDGVSIGASGCTQAGPSGAFCPATGVTDWQIQGGGGNDSMRVDAFNQQGLGATTVSVPVSLFGGPGQDTLIGGDVDDLLVNGSDMS